MNIDIKTADGEEIEFGGSYYDGRGTEHRVVGIRLTDYRRITNVSLSCLVGKVEDLCCVSMRPNELYSTPPDSWEKLEEDLDSCSASTRYEPCAYFSFSSDSCEKCPADPNKECLAQMVKHIALRIHKLRGES